MRNRIPKPKIKNQIVELQSMQISSLLDEVAELKKLIKHAYIHSGYNDCGFLQMTTEQKTTFGEILEASDMKACGKALRKFIAKP